MAEALAGVLASLQPDQAALLLYAMLDRKDPLVPKAVMEAAKSGPTAVRIAAISVIGGARRSFDRRHAVGNRHGRRSDSCRRRPRRPWPNCRATKSTPRFAPAWPRPTPNRSRF